MIVGGVLVAVVPFAPKYAVSRCGRVCRIAPRKNWPVDVSPWLIPWEVGEARYLRVNLDGKHYFVHRIVLITWVRQPEEGEEGSHIDGQTSNNSLDNLIWETHADNISRRYGHDTILVGTRNVNHKLSEDEVRAIRERTSRPHVLARVAEEFGVSYPTIRMIRDRVTWRHI